MRTAPKKITILIKATVTVDFVKVVWIKIALQLQFAKS